MKAFSGYAEWFWLMAMNWKDVENRGWPLTSYIKRSELPVRVYLHASKTKPTKAELAFIWSNLTSVQVDEFMKVDWSKYRGHIIGEITITNDITFGDIGIPQSRSKWFFGIHGFVVKDGVLYDKPIPCKGKLGFFTPDIKVK